MGMGGRGKNQKEKASRQNLHYPSRKRKRGGVKNSGARGMIKEGCLKKICVRRNPGHTRRSNGIAIFIRLK